MSPASSDLSRGGNELGSGITNPNPSRCIVSRPTTRFLSAPTCGNAYRSESTASSAPLETSFLSRASNSRRSSPRRPNSRTSCLNPAVRFGCFATCLRIAESESISQPVRLILYVKEEGREGCPTLVALVATGGILTFLLIGRFENEPGAPLLAGVARSGNFSIPRMSRKFPAYATLTTCLRHRVAATHPALSALARSAHVITVVYRHLPQDGLKRPR